jgi:hypothetical protein
MRLNNNVIPIESISRPPLFPWILRLRRTGMAAWKNWIPAFAGMTIVIRLE